MPSRRLDRAQRLALLAFSLEVASILAGHSRLGTRLPVNLASEDGHLVELLGALGLLALFASSPLGRLVREGGAGGESLFASFRKAHPLLKVSFSVLIVVGLALGIEASAWLVLRFAFGGDRPLFAQRLSGYRVFAESPEHGESSVIGEPGATRVVDRWGLLCDHEVSLEKPADTLRIFLTGGSAMAGAGQTGPGYDQVRRYPSGAYSYAASIAGAVRDALRETSGAGTVEVVNAAYNQKSFHQSLVHYLESLSRFHPDYVVNMDGYNDQRYFGEHGVARDGRPEDTWSAWETRFLNPFVELDAQARGSSGGSSTGRLATLLLERFARHASPASPAGSRRSEEQIRQDWDAIREQEIRGSRRWLETFGHYLAVLERDKVRLVFSIQPLLSRARGNKPLSPVEKAFDAIAVPAADAPAADLQGFASARHFLDDHFSAELRRRTEASGQVFCDLGDEIRSLDSGCELYTDYCHLTPEGNRIVGGILARKIRADLEARAKGERR